MRLGIDARPLQHETQYRGIGKALESLLLALKRELKADDNVVFYIDAGLPPPKIIKHYPHSQVVLIPTSRLGRKRYLRSVLPSFKTLHPRPSSVDVVLQYDASFGVPQNVPAVVVFHDLIPYLFRSQEKHRPVKGLTKAKDGLARNLYWWKYLRVLHTYKNARKIIAISQSSKNDLLKFVPGIVADKVVVIGHGVNQLKAAGGIRREIKQLAASDYLLYVGGVDIRKNIMELLRSFYELKASEPELKLMMVGKEFELKDRLAELGWFKLLSSRPDFVKDVVLPGFVTNDELALLYRQAKAFVLPSRYEGFGLPVLEAMSAGCPVIAYNNSSMAEVAGDAALLVPDGESLTPAIKKLLGNPKLRRKLIAKGYRQSRRFSWRGTAQKTLKVLRSAAS